MTRIYAEYIKNVFMEYPDYFMFLFFIITSFALVSVHDVLNNIPKDNFSNVFNFFVVALQKTSWVMQVLIAGFLIRMIFVGSKLTYKNIKNINTDWIMARFRY